MNATKQAAYDLAMSTDKAWHASLVQAFGKSACNRRYDMDQSGHPAECMRLHAEFRAAGDAWHAMMMAGPKPMTGQQAYEEDVAAEPRYSHGPARATWDDLPDIARYSWDRAPYSPRKPVLTD